jgi:hypothetical protein
MTIEYADDGKSDGDTEYAFNNLDSTYPHPTTFEPFQLVLDRVGLKIPAQMVREIKQDMLNNVGNKIVKWFTDPEGGLLARERVA